MADYGRPVRFGLFLTPLADHDRPLRLAELAEELDLDYIGVQDHPYQRRFLDTWTLLTAIALRTSHMRVFPDVANVPLRLPAVLAKSAASLDLLSGGRVELALGAGGFWDAIVAMGGPRRTGPESIRALEEAIRVIRLMWSDEPAVRFQGDFYKLSGVRPGPRPAHPIGIWLGVGRPRGLALTGRLADGFVPPMLGYTQPADLDGMNRRIDEAAQAAGREPAAIQRVYNITGRIEAGTAGRFGEALASLVLDHGMDTILLADGEDAEQQMRLFAREAVPRALETVEGARAGVRPV